MRTLDRIRRVRAVQEFAITLAELEELAGGEVLR